jgi:hypothetical protein
MLWASRTHRLRQSEGRTGQWKCERLSETASPQAHQLSNADGLSQLYRSGRNAFLTKVAGFSMWDVRRKACNEGFGGRPAHKEELDETCLKRVDGSGGFHINRSGRRM